MHKSRIQLYYVNGEKIGRVKYDYYRSLGFENKTLRRRDRCGVCLCTPRTRKICTRQYGFKHTASVKITRPVGCLY